MNTQHFENANRFVAPFYLDFAASSAIYDIASRVEVIAQGIEHTHDAADKSRQRSGALMNLSHSLKQEVGKFRV